MMTVSLWATVHSTSETTINRSVEDNEEDSGNETCCTEESSKNVKENKEVNATMANSEKVGFKTSVNGKNCDEQCNYEHEDTNYKKYRRLYTFDEAPSYLAHNPFILSGYRGIMSTKLCLESVFWWTNETINIWSHIFGFFLFISLTVFDMFALDVDAALSDKLIIGQVLICFVICMFLSALYHTFSCRSESDFHCFLSFDLFGIALCLLAIYTSGIYFAFWCNPELRKFYITTVTLIFAFAMALHLPRFEVDSHIKMLVFVGWAAYGVVPTVHWTIEMGGFAHPIVQLLLPRVLVMYIISGVAFFIYITRIPERFAAGKFDFLGHSHQWWHIIIVLALYYWHCSGILYVNYRINHTCNNNMDIDFF